MEEKRHSLPEIITASHDSKVNLAQVRHSQLAACYLYNTTHFKYWQIHGDN